MSACKSPLCLALLPLLFTLGCGGGPALPETVPTTGTVLYKGEPLSDATVVFYPEEGKPATGKTGPDGKFQLTTFDKNDGAIPGKHTVTVTPTAENAPPSNDPEALKKLEQSESKIPQRYSNQEETDLTAEVKPGENNDFKFELTEYSILQHWPLRLPSQADGPHSFSHPVRLHIPPRTKKTTERNNSPPPSRKRLKSIRTKRCLKASS